MPVTRFSLSRAFLTAAVSALLALHAWLALSATIDLGVTGDETVHLTGGYSYWRFNDYRLHPENGNLPQRWAALPLLLMEPRLEPRDRPELWSRSDVWQLGQVFFFETGNSVDFLLLCARSAMMVWSVGMALLVFWWSRQLWGDGGALFSLLLFVFSPTVLAHAPLVTSDMSAAFFLLAATTAWWRVTEKVSWGRLALSLLATGFAVVAKFSFALLVPTFLILSVARAYSAGTAVDEPRRTTGTVAIRLGRIALLGLAHLVFSIAFVWMCYGFRYSAFDSDLPAGATFFSSFEQMLPAAGGTRWILLFLQQHHVLPEAFIQGFTYVLYAARERPTFAAGDYSNTGWWWFFPFAFFVKSSLAELLAGAASLAALAIVWLRARGAAVNQLSRLIPLLVFAGVYGLAAVTSHLNIGQRHILVLYPILFIIAGAIASPHLLQSKRPHLANRDEPMLRTRFASAGSWVALILSVVGISESIGVRPDYLAFFNSIAGGPTNGWRLLGDSSLDWGQNLPKLAAWLKVHRRPEEKVYVSSFGADDLRYRGIEGAELAPYYSFTRERSWSPLKGGIYCIGTSMLQDAASPYHGWNRENEAIYQYLKKQVEEEIVAGRRSALIAFEDKAGLETWHLERARFARLVFYLRTQSPITVIGQTIFVYRLSDEQLRIATDGSLAELAGALAAARQ
ncbi:MAG: glycosyltransferase family 39 protein [Opitutus sp.]